MSLLDDGKDFAGRFIEAQLEDFARRLAAFRGAFGRDALRRLRCGKQLDGLDGAYQESRKDEES